MGLLDFGSRVLTEYKADVSDHKAKLKQLQGEEKKLAEAELAAAEARNGQIEDWIGKIGQVSLAIGGFAAVAKIAFDGYNEQIKESRLQTAAAGVDLEKLSQAAGGLQTHMQLLEFAAKVQTSSFKATNEQMQTAERFMRQLEARGVPTAEAYDAVTNAITTGRVKGLIPYGIVVNTHLQDLAKLGEENLTLAQKTELVTGVYKAMADATKGVVDGNENVGDSMRKTQVDLANSWDELKKGLGQLVVAMQPLLDALAKTVGYVAKIAYLAGGSGLPGGGGFGFSILSGGGAASGGLEAAAAAGLLGEQQHSTSLDFKTLFSTAMANELAQQEKDTGRVSEQRLFDTFDKLDHWLKKHQPPTDAEKKKLDEEAATGAARAFLKAIDAGLGSARNSMTRIGVEHDLSGSNMIGRFGLGAAAGTGDLSERSLTFGGNVIGSEGTGAGGEQDILDRLHQTEVEAQKIAMQRKQSILEHVFGPVGDFDLYKKGFEALTGAVGTAYDAWVSGSESAGTAVKRFIGESVMAVGRQMAIEAVKEGAYALGSLAIGDFAGATNHGIAAAEFAAGAVLAGVVANELGAGSKPTPTKGGGGGGGSVSTGGSGGGGYGGGGQQQQRSAVIVVGEAFDEATPRMRQLKAQQLVNRALGNGGYEEG